MKKVLIAAVMLTITVGGSVAANAYPYYRNVSPFPSARMAAINRIAERAKQYVVVGNQTQQIQSTCKGKVTGFIAVNSSLDFYDYDGHALHNRIGDLYENEIVTVLDGGKRYFSDQGNMYMYRVRYTDKNGVTKTGYAPAKYIDLI